MASNNFTENMRRTFASRFLKWGILLQESVQDNTTTHVIKKEGWQIKFIEGENAKGKFLEFYTIHPETHDTHFKIYEDGDLEELEALTDGYDYNETIPGDQDIERQKFIEKNRRIYDSLKEVGLQMY